MIKRIILLICAFLFCAGLLPSSDARALTKVRTIGDGESDDFILYSVHGAVVDADKNIFVLDGKGHRVVKFNWEGKFLKQFGQKGRGPKDLLSPSDLSIHDNKLYIDDWGNSRLVVVDTHLNYLSEIIWEFKLGLFPKRITRLANSSFLAGPRGYKKDSKKFHMFNDQLNKKKKEFFNYLPEKVDFQKNSLGINYFLEPKLGIHQKHKRILVSQYFAENSMRFFFFDFDGNPLGEFRYRQEAKFRLPLGLLHYKEDIRTFKEALTFSMVISIYPYKDDFLVFIGQAEDMCFSEEKFPIKTYCLVFSHTGEFKKKILCYGDMAVLAVTPDGYVLGKLDSDEDVAITIFKLNI